MNLTNLREYRLLRRLRELFHISAESVKELDKQMSLNALGLVLKEQDEKENENGT